MIIFDYGQTLVDEEPFDGLEGIRAILAEAADNPAGVSAEEVQAFVEELNGELGRFGTDFEKHPVLEIHNHLFQNYLYEYMGIKLLKPHEEVERIFENAGSRAVPTKNIAELLHFLQTENIRTAVISNISFSGNLLKRRIDRYLPFHRFEFILASSEYIFRKPHRRIFQLALKKAGLEPEQVWYCGDNAVFDVDGAASVGIFPVWYKGALEEWNKCRPQSPCLEINDWTELVDRLKK